MKTNQYWLVLLTTAMLTLSACGVNPVTKKREFQFISEEKEIAIGQKNYAPSRQSQGGDFVTDPELTAYVQSIGNKLAKVSDRQLPYEFVVLNNSVPNAWAMPGGKIAFNRGLLYELSSEAELAAVMGHELVHAAARHGAQGMERGMLLQGAVMAVGIGAQNTDYANLIVGGSQLGAQLISSKYGRNAESEADLYGMKYMKKAGYDPAAAVTLQETFVRLSADRKSNFLDGLFASHPPSQDRVNANKETLKKVGAGGIWGKEIYAKKMARIKATQPAYKAYDDGVVALSKGDRATATKLAKKAISIEPKEARFHELLGDIELSQKNNKQALAYYDKAIKLQPNYFKPHIQSGIALNNMGKKAEAASFFKRSNQMLPTAPAYYFLGEFAESRGDTRTALQNYQAAAGSKSEFGAASLEKFTRLDFPNNPRKYLRTGVDANGRGQLFAVVQNPSKLTLKRVTVHVTQLDPKTGRALGNSRSLVINTRIAPNQTGRVAVPGVRVKSEKQLRYFRTVVDGAQLAR